MAAAQEYLSSIISQAMNLSEENDKFLDEFVDELNGITETLNSITCTPHCDVCGAVDETVEWCGGCGCCVIHCQLDQACEDFATEMLELMQDGD